MSGYRNMVEHFLRSKGLNEYAIAGILGNIMVESGFNPNAYNSGEGAIGFCQWEGGRRVALRQWALNHHGADESDAQSQLGFMWHELNTGYTSVLHTLRNATSAGQAAAVFDAHFEISSGEARQERVDYANQYYSGKGPNPTYTGSGSTGGGGGGNSTDGGGGGGGLGAADYKSVDSLGNLLEDIPALHKILQEAVAHGWTLTRFENAVENSQWYKNHAESAREAIIQKANDPATWHARVQSTMQAIDTLSHQTGFDVSREERNAIAVHALMSGNDTNQQWLTTQLAHREDYSHLHEKGLEDLGGAMAGNVQQLQQMAGDYGFRWTPDELAGKAKAIVSGRETVDTYSERLKAWAASAFPAFRKDIMSGTTVRDLAAPYMQSMSSILELDPTGLSTYTPMIRNALQGQQVKGDWHATGLAQFERQLRSDPRWQYTDNAHQVMSQSLLQIGNIFGFGPDSDG